VRAWVCVCVCVCAYVCVCVCVRAQREAPAGKMEKEASDANVRSTPVNWSPDIYQIHTHTHTHTHVLNTNSSQHMIPDKGIDIR